MIELLVDNISEDSLLQNLNEVDYVLVYRRGHKILHRDLFFSEIDRKKDFFIMGHILDREKLNAYYELHTQCYIINYSMYKDLGKPIIGQMVMNSMHSQIQPLRSLDNYHDDYTPKFVSTGTTIKEYAHKAHGWNILSLGFLHNLPILVFNDTLRSLKEFDYEVSSNS